MDWPFKDSPLMSREYMENTRRLRRGFGDVGPGHRALERTDKNGGGGINEVVQKR